MASPPHLSSRLFVGVGSLVVTLGTLHLTRTALAAPPDLRSWPRRLVERVRTDLRRGETWQWLLVLGWGALVTLLHLGGLVFDIYTRLFWWDLVTHAMGGAGVAGILCLGLRDRSRTAASPWWLVGAVTAVGAGFEVYEFLFKSFWYNWSLRFYAVDTAVDIVVNALGAVGVVVWVGVWRQRKRRATEEHQRL